MKQILIYLVFASTIMHAKNYSTIIETQVKPQEEPSPVEKEKLYRSLCENYSFTNTDSAIFYGLKSIELCNQNPQIKNKEYVFYVLGETYLDVSLEEAKSYFFKAIEESKITKNDSVEHLAYFGLSSYYSNFSNVDSTLFYNTKSKDYFESMSDTNAIVNCYYNMMSIYSMTYDYNKVIEYGLLCENLLTNKNNHFLKGDVLVALSYAYNREGENKDLEKARYYLSEAEKIAKETNNLALLSNVYQVQGVRLYRIKEYEKAVIPFNKSLKITVKLKDHNRMSTTNFSIGSCYFKSGNYKEAAEYFKNVDKDFGVIDRKKASLYLALIYSNVDDTQSLKYFNEYNKLSKLLKSEKDAELLVEYESLEKEKENLALTIENQNKELENQKIKHAAQQNKFYLIIGIVSFIILSALALLYFLYKKRQAKQKIDNLQKQALQLQLNPHFFFNALNSINTFVGDEDSSKAKYYLSKFSKLMRLTLENSQIDEVLLEDELAFVENYMALEQMNNHVFDYVINVDDDLLDIKIPSMLLQPFVENSIEHAFVGLSYKGKITIDITENKNNLIVSIKDNGIGLSEAKIKSSHKSLAISILEQRIELYSKGKSKIEFSVPYPNQKNKGAQVTFKIPLS